MNAKWSCKLRVSGEATSVVNVLSLLLENRHHRSLETEKCEQRQPFYTNQVQNVLLRQHVFNLPIVEMIPAKIFWLGRHSQVPCSTDLADQTTALSTKPRICRRFQSAFEIYLRLEIGESHATRAVNGKR